MGLLGEGLLVDVDSYLGGVVDRDGYVASDGLEECNHGTVICK